MDELGIYRPSRLWCCVFNLAVWFCSLLGVDLGAIVRALWTGEKAVFVGSDPRTLAGDDDAVCPSRCVHYLSLRKRSFGVGAKRLRLGFVGCEHRTDNDYSAATVRVWCPANSFVHNGIASVHRTYASVLDGLVRDERARSSRSLVRIYDGLGRFSGFCSLQRLDPFQADRAYLMKMFRQHMPICSSLKN